MAIWQKENNQDKAIKLMLFVISPFFAMLYSLRTMNKKSSYVVFFMFAVFFGMSFTIESGKTEENRADSATYRRNFERYFFEGEFYYYERLQEYLDFEEGDKDFYFDTVAYFVSRVTENYHFLFMIFAIVFAFFALNTLKIFTSEKNFDNSYASYVLVALFMINDIFNINGVRFWTAAWIGVFCIFQIFNKNNNKIWLLLLLTPFVHGSYLVFIMIVALSYLLKKFERVWVALFFLSFALSSTAIDLILNNLNLLPTFLVRMAELYTSEEVVRGTRPYTTYQIIGTIFSFSIRVYLNYMVYLFIKNSKLIKSNPKTKNLYLFLLVWMSFVNFVLFVPSLGSRFFILSYPIIAYIWLVNFKDVKYTRLLNLIPLLFLFHFWETALNYIRVLDLEFYISNPFYLIYNYLISI